MDYLVASWVVWLYGCKVVGSLGQKTKNTTTGGPVVLLREGRRSTTGGTALYYGRDGALLREE